ncbi:Transcriptional regulatory protein [Kluyveromyces marxianus]|nr:Transcriptional regulatory protein [Kluyveromyces marxianus]KAG0678173.1 Transcriptional regulatory protein [Kluyveromyces marxianus]
MELHREAEETKQGINGADVDKEGLRNGSSETGDRIESGSTTKLTKEVLDRIVSDSDSGNSNPNLNLAATSYSNKLKSRSLSKAGDLDYEDNSSSGLSKVTSPEHPNSVSLSDIYVSSDAETEKMDLEEDESRVKLSEMVVANGDDSTKPVAEDSNKDGHEDGHEEKQEDKQEILQEVDNSTEPSSRAGVEHNNDKSEVEEAGNAAVKGVSDEDKNDNSEHLGSAKEKEPTLPEQENNSAEKEELPEEEHASENGKTSADSPESEEEKSGVPEKRKLDEEPVKAEDETRGSEDNESTNIKTEQVFKKPKLPSDLKPGTYENEQETHRNGEHEGDIDADAEAEEEEVEDDGVLESELDDNNEDEEELEPEMEEEDDEDETESKKKQDTENEDSAQSENGLSPMEIEKLRQEALSELTKIEVEFAKLRQSLYENKLAKLQNELQMCLDGSHPQLQTYYQKIDSIRDFKLKRMYQRQKYELECIDKETRATRTFIHQDFYRKVSDLKHKLLSDTTQKWYDINKERREMDVVVPEVNYHVPIKIANKSLSCITGYAAPAHPRRPGDVLSEDLLCENINFRYHNNPVDKLEVIVDRMRFNNELSDLDGLKRYYGGFPGAPELGSLKESEIHEDLTGIQHR